MRASALLTAVPARPHLSKRLDGINQRLASETNHGFAVYMILSRTTELIKPSSVWEAGKTTSGSLAQVGRLYRLLRLYNNYTAKKIYDHVLEKLFGYLKYTCWKRLQILPYFYLLLPPLPPTDRTVLMLEITTVCKNHRLWILVTVFLSPIDCQLLTRPKSMWRL